MEWTNSEAEEVANANIHWEAHVFDDLLSVFDDDSLLAAHHVFDAAADNSNDFTFELCDLSEAIWEAEG